MALGGYSPIEDLVYTVLEIGTSVAALHVASTYDLRRWIAVCSLKWAIRPQSRGAIRKDGNNILLKRFSTFSIYLSNQNVICYISALDQGWALNTFNFAYMALFMGVGVYRSLAFPLQQVVSLGGFKLSLSSQLWHCISPPNRLRFALAVLLPLALLLSTYYGSRVLQPLMTAVWVLGISAPMQSTQMEMKKRILWINCIVVAVAILYAAVTPIQSYISFVFRGRKPELQPIWILRLWLGFCPAIPSIIVGRLLGPTLRFDTSRDRGAIEFPDAQPDGSVLIPLSIGQFPAHTYKTSMVGFIAARMSCQWIHKDGSRQVTDLKAKLPAVIGVSLVMLIQAWSGGFLKAWWAYSEEWNLPSPTLEDRNGPRAEVTAADGVGQTIPGTGSEKQAVEA